MMSKLFGKQRGSNEVVIRSGEESGRIRNGDKLAWKVDLINKHNFINSSTYSFF